MCYACAVSECGAMTQAEAMTKPKSECVAWVRVTLAEVVVGLDIRVAAPRMVSDSQAIAKPVSESEPSESKAIAMSVQPESVTRVSLTFVQDVVVGVDVGVSVWMMGET